MIVLEASVRHRVTLPLLDVLEASADRPRGEEIGLLSPASRSRPRDRPEVPLVRALGRGRAGSAPPSTRRSDGFADADVLAVAEVFEPGDQLEVHRVRAHDHLRGRGELLRPDDHRAVLPAAEPAVAADQSLERRHLADYSSSRLFTYDVGRSGIVAAAARTPPRRAEPRERVLSHDHGRSRSRAAGRSRPGPVDGVDHREPDAGMRDQARHQRREAVSSSSSQRQPPRLARDVDQARLPEPKTRNRSGSVLAASVCSRSFSSALRRRTDAWSASASDALPSARPSTVSAELESAIIELTGPLPSALYSGDRHLRVRQPSHQRREVLAVPVGEDRPLDWPWSDSTTKW